MLEIRGRAGHVAGVALIDGVMKAVGAKSITGSVLIALCLAGCGGSPRSDAAIHTNERYGFAIQYPDSLDLRVYTDEYAAIGTASGEAFDAEAEVLVEMGEGESFEDFVVSRARVACAADGPGISLLCTTVRRHDPFTSAAGIEGRRIVLGHVTARAATGEIVERSERGPFIAFDLSGAIPDLPADSRAALFIRAPVVLEPEAVDTALVRGIAESVRWTGSVQGRGTEPER